MGQEEEQNNLIIYAPAVARRRRRKRKRILPLAVTLAALAVAAAAVYYFFDPGITTAATVNGKTISESMVTERCVLYRAQNPGFASDAGWAKALVNSNLTPESLRAQVIHGMASDLLVREAAMKEGITVDEQTVDSMLDQLRQSAGNSKDAWDHLLLSYAVTNDAELRAYLEQQNLNAQLMAKIAPADPNASQDEQAAQSAKYQEYLKGLLDHAVIEIKPMPAKVPYNVDMNLANAG